MGFDLLALSGFIGQAGLAVAGASAFWGLIFIIQSDKKKESTDGVTFRWLAYRLFYLMSASAVVALVGRLIKSDLVFAHEGIILIPSLLETQRAFEFTYYLFIIWIIFVICSVLLKFYKQEIFDKIFKHILLSHFIIIFALVSFPAITETFGRGQLFYMGHSFHSIFTVGTVIILDFLYLISKKSLFLKQNIFPFFPTISKVIWVGLAFDFLSVALVFNEAIALTPRFFFMQTIIGILIINGALLSGPLTKIMLSTVAEKRKKLSAGQTLWADIAGTVSITSWLTITFIDYFHDLTLSYIQLMIIYLIVVLTLFIGHRTYEHIDKKRMPAHKLAQL